MHALLSCLPTANVRLPPFFPPLFNLQDIIKQWATLPPSSQAAVFDTALIAAADGSWADLADQLQLALDVAGP